MREDYTFGEGAPGNHVFSLMLRSDGQITFGFKF